jgi:hypothetical protein
LANDRDRRNRTPAPEEVDSTGEQIGTSSQALTHLALIPPLNSIDNPTVD